MLAAFLAGELDRYDCGKCPPELQEQRGCREDAKSPLLQFEDGSDLKRCPVRSITPEIARLSRAYRYAKQGLFPAAGGWLDQSATMIEALDLLDKEVASYAEARRTRDRRPR